MIYRKVKSIRKLIFISFFLAWSLSSFATHIVGGNIHYRLLDPDANRYMISVQIFFDCTSTNGAIGTDKDLFISMHNARTNRFMGDFMMKRGPKDNLGTTSYKCVENPTNLCVSAYSYTKSMIINPGSDGVILAWERCCRNGNITNISEPGKTGFTAWTVIPPGTILNSSAFFLDIPPVYVCVDAPLTFSQEAMDPDGDSLVYELVTPFLGATPDAPRPDNGSSYSAPPFQNFSWRGVFSRTNQMGGDPKLSIDSKTGLLQVTPDRTGLFVVGYKVIEYRDGVAISETRRDYQFNVIDCNFTVLSNYDVIGGVSVNGIYTFECGDTVCFRNKSFSKLPATYHWDFGVETAIDDTSTAYHPCFVFPGNGDYNVTLTVTSPDCEDKYTYSVRIRSSKPFELGRDVVFCEDFVKLLDTKAADAISFLWSTGEKTSRIYARDTGRYWAEVSYGECSYSDTIIIRSDKLPPIPLLPDSLFCDEVDMEIIMNLDVSGLHYKWNTGRNDTSRSIRVTKAGIYSVEVSNENCSKSRSMKVWQATDPKIGDAFYCDTFTHRTTLAAIEQGQYLWSNNSTSQNTTYSLEGNHWVKVTQRHCVNFDTFEIGNSVIYLDLEGDRHFCDRIDVSLDAGNEGSQYAWNTGASTRSVSVRSPGKYSVTVTDTNGCSMADSVEITLSSSPRFELGDDTTICVNSPISLSAPSGFSGYRWSTGGVTQSVLVQDEGWFSVTVIDEQGCSGLDSVYITVDASTLPNELFIPNAFTPNGDGLNELFPYSKPVIQPGYYMAIYTRWGEKVFDSRTSEYSNWNGYYKGRLVPSETLMYIVQYRGCDGNRRIGKGTVIPLY